MARTTVDYGIDLGTTNSCIAVLQGTQAEVIRNNANQETSPSAVWMDKKGRMYVGQKAKDEFERDPENAAIEFKLLMGTEEKKLFQRAGQSRKPEELSAEVLKSLLGDVRQRQKEEEVSAAVITVPAAFELPQCNATRQAAQLAGLSFSPLLQEPVAAALAYGFQSASEKVYWLVYDLGGGTFDAALMKLQDGEFRVVNHGGDNHLGGKYLDWEIVDKLLAPAAARQFGLTDFHRRNPDWRGAFAVLKQQAELAKILLSREEVATINPELADKAGQRFDFEYELRRGEVEQLLEPILERSINICRKVLKDKGLKPADVEKVLLVGGPSLTPMLRERLADHKAGLGIPLDFSQDPMTVVARGAAIFAGTQKQKEVGKPQLVAGQFTLDLEHQPVGADPEPLVGGKVIAPSGQSLAGFTIEFVDNDARPPWRSGKISVSASAVFTTTLRAEKGRGHSFLIELRDAGGRSQPVSPDRLSYTMGNVAAAAPLIHSLGIAMANNKMDVILEKGTSLPARKRSDHRSTGTIRPGQQEAAIRIPIIEGENYQRAELNRKIGELLITGASVKAEIHANTPIEITLEMDESRMLTARALIGAEDYEMVIQLGKAVPNVADLQEDFHAEEQQWQSIRQKAITLGDNRILDDLDRLDREGTLQEIAAALAAAANDPDAAQKCQNRLLDLKSARARMEDLLEWPALEAQASAFIGDMQAAARESQSVADRQQAAALELETRQALQGKDAHILRQKLQEVDALIFTMLWQQPGFCIGVFQDLGRRSFPDPRAADKLIQAGNRAIADNDLGRLKDMIGQLFGLLPVEQRKSVGYGGTTIR